MWNVFVGSAISIVGLFSVAFVVYLISKRKDIADVFWGLGFIVASWSAYGLGQQTDLGLIVCILVTLWGVRLAFHIFTRNRHKAEDYRYHGFSNLQQILVKVFLLQAALLWIVAFPIFWIQASNVQFSYQRHFFLILVWFFGFICESLADYQLKVFLSATKRKEKFCTTKLWSISRHPNYAGEIIQWWAIALLAIDSTFSLLLLISPLLLTWIIIKISGVAPLEKKYAHNQEYITYKSQTPCLFPASWINSCIFYVSWFAVVVLLAKGYYTASFITGVMFIFLQLLLFRSSDKKSFILGFPLICIGIVLATIFEKIYLNLGLITYVNSTSQLPLGILTLYAFFCLSLNSSMQFLNKKLWLAGVLGAGALFSYLFGQKLGAVQLLSRFTLPDLFIGWGLYLILMVLVNRDLQRLYKLYTDPEHLKEPLVVFFDLNCPICKKEKENLQKRQQTGNLIYASCSSKEQIEKYTSKLSLDEALSKISAVNHQGLIMQGVPVLSEVYARTNHLILAIFLQAPVLKYFFNVGYIFWVQVRPRTS